MILTQVLRTHIRCDRCMAAFIHTEGDIGVFLTDHGWRITGPDFIDDNTVGERHVCPRCARRQP